MMPTPEHLIQTSSALMAITGVLRHDIQQSENAEHYTPLSRFHLDGLLQAAELLINSVAIAVEHGQPARED